MQKHSSFTEPTNSISLKARPLQSQIIRYSLRGNSFPLATTAIQGATNWLLTGKRKTKSDSTAPHDLQHTVPAKQVFARWSDLIDTLFN